MMFCFPLGSMKNLYLSVFFYCTKIYAMPPIIQYLLDLFPIYKKENIGTIPLSSELEIYLEGKVASKTESASIAKFNISDLTDLSLCNHWCEMCWRFTKIELEQILYKFYTNKECPYEKNILRFLNFCLNTYEHEKEKEYPLDLKALSIIHKERFYLNKVIATM